MCWRQWCWEHSLSIALVAFTAVAWTIGPFIEGPRLYDFVMNLGHDAASAALLFIFSAWFWDRNRPDAPE
jgi:hypothetical protein